jgi:predicted nuclease of predicted toxin-antitoxin system
VKLVVDMNLSPDWCAALRGQGWEAVHWSAVGDPRASDRSILEWTRNNGYVLFTHDLDFGALLAASGAGGPSVVQVRTQDVAPDRLAGLVAAALRDLDAVLERGAIVSIDESSRRARVLPIRP